MGKLNARWLQITGIIPVTIILYILALISIAPIIAWWAGLLGLIPFAYLMYVRLSHPHTKIFEKNHIRHWYKIIIWILFFGLVVHFSCGTYTCFRMIGFSSDASEEKERVFETLKKDNEQRKSEKKSEESKQKEIE